MKMNETLPAQLQAYLYQQMLFKQHQLVLHHHNQSEKSSTGWYPQPSSTTRPYLSEDIKVELRNKQLWQKFHAETTEMIITKLGRRMFPQILLSISGMDRNAYYCLLVELIPMFSHRYKFVGSGGESDGKPHSGGWIPAGLMEPQPHVSRRVYLHPDGPATGAHWMNQPVNFNKLKLTNNVNERHSNIILTSMHKYVPKIWIVRYDDITRLNALYSQPATSFVFEETRFIAVTAYQNENITKLKIDNNPFAKGFRETGHSRCKRKLDHLAPNEAYPGCQDADVTRNEADDDNDEGAEGFEEVGNLSSTESECSSRTSKSYEERACRKKRILAGTSDRATGSREDSSDSSSPPLILPDSTTNHHHQHHRQSSTKDRRDHCCENQPHFHRPWLESPVSSSTIKTSSILVPSSLPASPLPPSVYPLNTWPIVGSPHIFWSFLNLQRFNEPHYTTWHLHS